MDGRQARLGGNRCQGHVAAVDGIPQRPADRTFVTRLFSKLVARDEVWQFIGDAPAEHLQLTLESEDADALTIVGEFVRVAP